MAEEDSQKPTLPNKETPTARNTAGMIRSLSEMFDYSERNQLRIIKDVKAAMSSLTPATPDARTTTTSDASYLCARHVSTPDDSLSPPETSDGQAAERKQSPESPGGARWDANTPEASAGPRLVQNNPLVLSRGFITALGAEARIETPLPNSGENSWMPTPSSPLSPRSS